MFSDHDNPVSSAATAAAQESETPQNAETTPAAEAPATAAPVQAVKPEEAHAHAEAQAQTAAVDAEAAAAAEEAASAEEMSKLIDQYGEPQEAASQNEIIEVKVVAYTEHGVVVDLGGKTEGLIPASEFTETEVPRPDPNSTIEVQRTGETKDSFVIVSYQKVLRRRTWEKLDAQFKAKETLTAKVVDRIKGGLVVDIGVRAFLPGSQYDLRPTSNLDGLLGQEVQVRITKLNRRRGNVVVSRRALLEEELHAKRAELMEKLSEGQTVHGTVK
ncbi:MAG TPA: S1 RNA-binding domain-containing protein, partial [Candidatus Acidoferrum sp.]|nr:S1 RNA-binding domain-containing protein [Candidatus Acidoferrum sp.]